MAYRSICTCACTPPTELKKGCGLCNTCLDIFKWNQHKKSFSVGEVGVLGRA